MQAYLQKMARYPAFISKPPASDLEIVVVIPSRLETGLLRALDSLGQAAAPRGGVEVIVVLNDSDADPPEVQSFHRQQKQALENIHERFGMTNLTLHVVHITLPARHAGVGSARKAGMDEAVRRYQQLDRPGGLIIGYDADTMCQANYFQAIEKYFFQNPNREAVSIHYEHPVSGSEFSSEIYEAIVEYELHLRFYIDMQRELRFPWAFHTIGSAFAVRAGAYCKQGGMNRRQAGEDFYFLHKFTTHEQYGEILDTTVIPSPRPSDRVPFGTGKAVGNRIKSLSSYTTYHPDSFKIIQSLVNIINWKTEDYDISPKVIPDGLISHLDLRSNLTRLKQHTASREAFRDQFYQWFNAFRLMKALHWLAENGYPRLPVGTVMEQLYPGTSNSVSLIDHLQHYREKQRAKEYSV